VAYVTPHRGEAVAFIANVQTGDAKPFLKSGKGPEKLRWCSFVTDQRLVCRYGGWSTSGMLIPFSRLIAVNSDGSGMKELGQSQSFYDAGYRQYDGHYRLAAGSGGSVLMQRSYIPERARGTRMVRRTDGLGVDRIDTNTAKSRHGRARRDASFYLSDGIGNVRVMARGNRQWVTDQLLTGRLVTIIAGRTHEWKP